ncbi:MAG TPA: hypothetical protein VMW16_14520 [Sedimentisphaerales bacterium]|nr:hypothetical protein [Sedimentisphaerales bacterium]
MDTQKRKHMKLFTRITAILSLVILVGFTGIGIYVWMQGDNGEASEVLAWSGGFIIFAGILCFIGTWILYGSIRWIQIPAWRWMAGGFKGTPETPLTRFVMTREQIAEAKKEMSRLQRIWMWVGNVCASLGVIFLLVAVTWRLVLDVTGERTTGSTANMIFVVGVLTFFLGVLIVRMSMKRGAKNRYSEDLNKDFGKG